MAHKKAGGSSRNGRRRFTDVEDCVDQVLARLGRRIVLCTPIGAGKPVALVNEFYRRAELDPRIELAILTGLTLARPQPSGELARRLFEPITAKIYGSAPEPAWVAPLRASRLPPNVRVQEFFFEPGAWLGSPLAQQSYASINYTHVAAQRPRRGRERDRAAGRGSAGWAHLARHQPGRHRRSHPDAP